jgi:Flp pilus assembly protein TadB
MQIQHAQESLAAAATGSTLISWFVATLPVVQWIAAAVAVVTGALYFINLWRNRKKK